MNNFLKPGKRMTYTAPAGGVTSGGGYLIGALFVVAASTAAAGTSFEGDTEGMFTLAKTTGEGALIEGQPVYWDVANSKATIDHTIGLPIGTVAAAALTADTSCSVRLHGLSLAGRMLSIRKRFTVAQVNAGATLLPALPGLKYRMMEAKAIAVGGAATSVTTVDLKATQATVVQKLVAFAQASLTQSAVVRDGGTGGAVLADGASYAANDVNTAMTVGVTGAAITVATSIDFIVHYMIEA
jgi:predicted RecA/RadA family phage recombinase